MQRPFSKKPEIIVIISFVFNNTKSKGQIYCEGAKIDKKGKKTPNNNYTIAQKGWELFGSDCKNFHTTASVT